MNRRARARGAADVAEGRFIHGFHAITAKLRQVPDAVLEIYLAQSRSDARARDLVKLAEAQGVRVHLIDVPRLDGMAGHARHQGVVAKVTARERQVLLDDVLDSLSGPALLLVLDGIQDPHNLGACLRVADGAGASAVVAPKDRAVGLNATAIRVSCGAADSVPFVTVTNLAQTLSGLNERGIWTLGLDADAQADLYSIAMPESIALVLGAEGAGLRRLTRERCEVLARIPMHGSVESLNVSVAAGICLFEARRRRSCGPGPAAD